MQFLEDNQKILLFVFVVFVLWVFFLREGFVNGYSKNWKISPHSRPADYPLAAQTWFMSESGPNGDLSGLPNSKDFY